MTTNNEILEAINNETKEIKKILDEHILLQENQDKKLNKTYEWLFLGNGSSAKSEIERNSEYRKNANKTMLTLVLMVIAQWVAILVK